MKLGGDCNCLPDDFYDKIVEYGTGAAIINFCTLP